MWLKGLLRALPAAYKVATTIQAQSDTRPSPEELGLVWVRWGHPFGESGYATPDEIKAVEYYLKRGEEAPERWGWIDPWDAVYQLVKRTIEIENGTYRGYDLR